MIPCPVCEQPHDARAAECPSCGKVFAVQAVPDVAAGGLADLDVGRMDSRQLNVAAEAVPELEHASDRKVGKVAAEVVPELERTAVAAVGEIAAEVAPDLEQTRLAEREWTPEATGPLVCRYCSTPQSNAEAFLCERCGFRLPRRQLQDALLLTADDQAEPERAWVKCPDCGARTPPGELCQACGVLMRPQSA